MAFLVLYLIKKKKVAVGDSGSVSNSSGSIPPGNGGGGGDRPIYTGLRTPQGCVAPSGGWDLPSGDALEIYLPLCLLN